MSGSVFEECENAIDNTRPFHDLIIAVARATHKTYGWRVEYLRASLSSLQARPVNERMMVTWQRSGRVPNWAVEQVSVMEFRRPSFKKPRDWNREETEFLIHLYQSNEYVTYQRMAELCQQKFDRDISEQAIKGMLDRLRKKNKIDKGEVISLNTLVPVDPPVA